MATNQTTPPAGGPPAQPDAAALQKQLAELQKAVEDLKTVNANQRVQIEQSQEQLKQTNAVVQAQTKTIEEHKATDAFNELKTTKQKLAEAQQELSKTRTANVAAIETPKVDSGKMPVRSCRVRLSKDQDVALKEITPAEACLLIALHHKNVGDNPLHDFGTCVKQSAIHYTDPDNPKARPGHKPRFEDGKHVGSEVKLEEYTSVDRNASDEVARLASKYGKKRVKALYPGAMPTLPATFDEAVKIGLTAELGDEKLSVGEIKV